MPTIEVSRKVLEKLAGRKIKDTDLERVKGNIDSESGGIIRLEIEDTNRPDLWSVEGVARVFRENGMPRLKIKKSGKGIIVDKNIEGIRPYIAGFLAKDIPMTEELLKDVIQLQEKIAENFGRKRQKISVGIYNYRDAVFPLHYKAVDPKSVKFAPLEFVEKMDLEEILIKHPKGQQYGSIVKRYKMYPIFIDSANQVLSFPPIINSNSLGRVEVGMEELFVEVTGNDILSVNLVANILALALQDRNASIESIRIRYPYKTVLGKNMDTPHLFNERISFPEKAVKERLGIELPATKIISLLKSMQYHAARKGNNISVKIPYYRRDIMHPFDVIEDVAIAYGYPNIEPLDITSHTTGKLSRETVLSEKIRRSVIGLGFQETMNPILSNKKDLQGRMLSKKKIVEIENYMSETYSAVRNSVLPSLLHILGRNLHVEYPQKIFELGECVDADRNASTVAKLAACISDSSVGYEDISSVADALFRMVGIGYRLEESHDSAFVEGRQAFILINKKPAGILGEINPQVLENWGIDMPVAALEIDVTRI